MARERAKLSEKQERILVQCQLMGLTPRDMQQISNRLIALQKESEWRKEVADVSAGMSWEKTDKGWKIVDSQGKTFVFAKANNKISRWDNNRRWDVEVSKPGTRFKVKQIKDVNVYIDPYITARVCPDNSKELFGLLNSVFKGRIS